MRTIAGAVVVAGLALVATMLLVDRSTSALLDFATDLGKPAAHRPEPRTPSFLVATVAEEPAAWRIEMITPADCRVALSCDVTFRLVPAPGWHANREYPYKFRGSLPQNAAFSFATTEPDRMTFNRASGHVDLTSDGSAQVHVVVIPHAPGHHRVTGRLRVSACTTELCRIGSHDIDVEVPAT